MNTVSLQIRLSDGEVDEQENISVEQALRQLLSHDWNGELARTEGIDEPDWGQVVFAIVTASNGDDLLVYPQMGGTFNIIYLRNPVSGVAVPGGTNRLRRIRDDLSLNALAEVVTHFAADDRDWMIATTATFARCVAAFISLPALIIGVLAGGGWYLPKALGFSMSKDLSVVEIVMLIVWFTVLITVAVALWLGIGRLIFTRMEAQYAWTSKLKIDAWIFDKVFPETLTVAKDSNR